MKQAAHPLSELGYSPNEADFLSVVTGHSGYFLRRQFYTYHESTTGAPATLFLRKLLAKKHAESYKFARGNRVFHVYSRHIYRTLGREHVRFRKQHETRYIKTKLLALDFVIQHKGFTYLLTEADKLTYFAQLGIEKRFLPATTYKAWNHTSETTRYFVDKFPLFLRPDGADRTPTVCFTFIDPGLTSIDTFISHVRKYTLLFSKLERFTLIYIADHPRNFKGAEGYFSTALAAGLDLADDGKHYSPAELRRFFELQSYFDQKKFHIFTPEVVTEYQAKKARFASKKFTALYELYRAGAPPTQQNSSSPTRPRVSFETFLAPELNSLFEASDEN